VAERREDVRPGRRVDQVRAHCAFEVDDRLAVVTALRCGRPKDEVRSRRGELVAQRLGLAEDRLDLSHREVVVEAEAQLGVGQSKLAELARAHVRAGLEVFRRHAKPAGERPERLHRRSPRPSFDPRDVRVRDARRRELAL
jgi:hypothetical protein